MPRQITRESLAVLLTALLTIGCFPKFNFSSLAWIALVPLAWTVSQTSPRRAFFIGWITGTFAYIGILYWIAVTFLTAGLSWLLALTCLTLLAAYLGLFWGAWSSLLSLRPVMRLPLMAAAGWVVLEYIRTYLFSGFPWTLLGDTQWHHLPMIQIASLTGVYGVSFLIVLVNVTLAVIASEAQQSQPFSKYWRSPRPLWSLAMTTGAILICYSFGVHRVRAFAAEPVPSVTLRIALLQGNIDQYKKWDQAYVNDIEQTYEKLNAGAETIKPDLIVWPETSVPGYLLQEPLLRKWLDQLVQKTQTAHLVGAPSQDQNGHAYNTACLITPQGILGQYDKQHLVPFGEIVPWAGFLGRWIHVLNELGGFTAGHRSSVLLWGSTALGVNICYEAIFPNRVRQSVKQGAQFIANLTNDGWYMRTAAPYQHFIPNVFRAVENDRWLIRADNTGISGIINPIGQVTSASPIFEAGVIEGEIHPRTHLTLYTRVGDLFAWLCVIFCVGVGTRAILRRP